MTAPRKPAGKPKAMKPTKAWAVVSDSGKCWNVLATESMARFHCPSIDHVVRVLVTEIPKGGKT